MQVQSGKDHFSTETLKENLELLLTQLQNKGNEGQRKKGTIKRQHRARGIGARYCKKENGIKPKVCSCQKKKQCGLIYQN